MKDIEVTKMGAGVHGGFGSTKGFNGAGSKDVGRVDKIKTTHNLHSVPMKGDPNTVSKNYKNGKLDSERYYDKNGNPYLDIDYSNHGNPKMHPNVPHQHKYKNGKRVKKGERINK